MGVTELSYYILFDNYTQGLALKEQLDGAGLKARIAPTPRTIDGSHPCGMSLLVREEDIAAVRDFLEQNGAEYLRIAEVTGQIQPGRDRYC